MNCTSPLKSDYWQAVARNVQNRGVRGALPDYCAGQVLVLYIKINFRTHVEANFVNELLQVTPRINSPTC
jgi:hypothetical protein